MAQRQPQQAPVRKRITPQLVHPLDPGDASPADAAGAVSSAVSVWRIAPAVAPADPDAFSKLGPGRRIYVDLEACGHIADWRAVSWRAAGLHQRASAAMHRERQAIRCALRFVARLDM
jgi:hypothetical protein